MKHRASKPNFCGFLVHTVKRLFFTEHYHFHTWLGLLLVALNVPVGWGGAAVCVFIAANYDLPSFYSISALTYLSSWLMLGLGLLLAVRGTVRGFRARIPRAWKAWKLIRNS